MTESIAKSKQIEKFLDRVAGLDQPGGNPRLKTILRRVVSDLYVAIEELKITENEYWAAISYLTELGQAGEVGLLSPGLGFDHFQDLLMDAQEKEVGITGGTPRTIEGPLYVYGAPLVKGEARLDDGKTPGEVLFMQGRVTDDQGKPLADAIVDVWHADAKGNYSYFDPSQSAYNLRRRIQTGPDGRYAFRSIVPAGYATKPGGPTTKLLEAVGRHGKRPAHIHFFISARGHRHLTTQLNMADDPLVHDDFAFATREGLIPPLKRVSDPEEIAKRQLSGPFTAIDFDFQLHRELGKGPQTEVERARAMPEKA